MKLIVNKKLPKENKIVLSRYLQMFIKITSSKKTLLTPETFGMVFLLYKI
jgi:hypothetical protein